MDSSCDSSDLVGADTRIISLSIERWVAGTDLAPPVDHTLKCGLL